ncbi:NTP transferase domain-containing protein [Microbacteriaceae bacterium VKM Ac-2855]|nr:NTP transferase domain-containing protein [Microbacteriaceae bacterium VKM Ac-2855]
MTVIGLVLAAGAGRRAGGPKALRRAEDGTPWLVLAVERMRGAGCADVVVLLGAGADEASALVPASAQVVVVTDWTTGASAALRAGIDAAGAREAEAVLVTLVDLPTATIPAARRVLADAKGPTDLAQATHGGRPGHPVLIGRAHWAALTAELTGDTGARDYLRAHGARLIECGDLESGDDVDR